MKKFWTLGLSFVLCISLVGCGSKSSNKYADYAEAPAMATSEAYYNGGDYGYAYSEESAYEGDYKAGDTDFQSSEILNDSARKLIKTYNLDIETETFDELMASIEERISFYRGYIQDMNSYNGSLYNGTRSSRSANMTVRIPSSNLESFVQFVGEASNITNKSLNVQDVTLQYVDTESRKETYEIEQERLLSLLEKTENVEDMIALESRLSEVRYKLESQASQLRIYDNLVDYATVYLYVNEVTKYTPPTPISYGERVARSFEDAISNWVEGLKDFVVGFVGAVPGLLTFIVIAAILFFVIRAIVKSKKKKSKALEEAQGESKYYKALSEAEEKAKENGKL